ncbi:MAG: hypothetical protein IT463_04270 [Planctomycetes bacterium]|nr:hypothetical protein [Planctomycetota bacterium]
MVNEITMAELTAALAARKVHAIYDNRGAASYGALHIKGALNLPVADVAAGKVLPADKRAFLVFY